MKKKLFIIVNILCFTYTIHAQLLQTYTGDNYSGINGASLQPASIADSRYKFDILLVGAQFSRSSNYGAYNSDLLSNYPVKPSHYRQSKGSSYYYNDLGASFLSFMITLTPKDAIGFTKSSHTITNVDGMDPDMALLLLRNLNDTTLNNKVINNSKLSYQQMTYRETAITYARVIMNNNERFLKAGATFKILNGQEAMYLYNTNANVTPLVSSNVQLNNSQFSYGYSKYDSKGFNNKLGYGFDLGVVYEFRPNYKNYYYDMDGKKGIVCRDLNKYKFKFSASLLDVGKIKFTKTDSSGDFKVNQTVSGIADVDNSDIKNVNAFITSNFKTTKSGSNTFKMNLPTALSIQADYFFRGNVYFGYMSYLPIWLKSDKEKIHNIMTNVVSARYEKRDFGIGAPVSLVRNGQIFAGLNIRYKFFTVGTTNLSSYFVGKRRLYDVNVYAAFRLSLAYPAPADKDGDKVSDKMDDCPNNPGPLSLKGCPDSDLDGVPDYKDVCPNAPGPIKLGGCPDTDSDGILDYQDACPTERGFEINKGCPDRDVDGILDVADRCPDVPGIPENNGCPAIPIVCCADSDGDGILDKFDDCPEVFGALINKGCPVDSSILNEQNNLKMEELKKFFEKKSEKTSLEKSHSNSSNSIGSNTTVNNENKNKNADTKSVINSISDQNKTSEKSAEQLVVDMENQTSAVAKEQTSTNNATSDNHSDQNKSTGKSAEQIAADLENQKSAIAKEQLLTTNMNSDNQSGSNKTTEKKKNQIQKDSTKLILEKKKKLTGKNKVEDLGTKGNNAEKETNTINTNKHKIDTAITNIKPLATVYFDTDDYKVKDMYYDNLNLAVEQMLNSKTSRLIILGHTDSEGASDYNINLSKKRSKAVREYVTKKANGQIDQKRIEVLYFGENKPASDNSDEKQKQMNRRVELRIIP